MILFQLQNQYYKSDVHYIICSQFYVVPSDWILYLLCNSDHNLLNCITTGLLTKVWQKTEDMYILHMHKMNFCYFCVFIHIEMHKFVCEYVIFFITAEYDCDLWHWLFTNNYVVLFVLIMRLRIHHIVGNFQRW